MDILVMLEENPDHSPVSGARELHPVAVAFSRSGRHETS